MADAYNLETLLARLCDSTEGETISVRDLLDAAGARAYGPVLTVLGFISISPLTLIPGANWLVSFIILVFALQMALGRAYPWIPARALRVTFPRHYLVSGVRDFRGVARQIDRLIQPRLTWLTGAPFLQLVALICISAALVSLPLGLIPFGPVLPGVAILLFGLAVTARDGVLLIAACAALFGSGTLLLHVWSLLPAFSLDF
jgi:hypothetical protein